MDFYQTGSTAALQNFGVKQSFYVPLALGGAATQTLAPLGYGLEGGNSAPEGEGVRRGLSQAGASLLGGIIGNVVGTGAGMALHAFAGMPPNEAFITAAMMNSLLGGAGSIGGGELARHHFKKKDATSPSESKP